MAILLEARDVAVTPQCGGIRAMANGDQSRQGYHNAHHANSEHARHRRRPAAPTWRSPDFLGRRRAPFDHTASRPRRCSHSRSAPSGGLCKLGIWRRRALSICTHAPRDRPHAIFGARPEPAAPFGRARSPRPFPRRYSPIRVLSPPCERAKSQPLRLVETFAYGRRSRLARSAARSARA